MVEVRIFDFVKKVITSARLGIPLKEEEVNALKHLLENKASLAVISSAAILAAVEALEPRDERERRRREAKIHIVKTVLDTWSQRAEAGKTPVIKESEVKILERALNDLGLDGKRLATYMRVNFDILLSEAFAAQLERMEEKKKEKKMEEGKKEEKISKVEKAEPEVTGEKEREAKKREKITS